MDTLGSRMKHVREERGFTQEQLARAAGVSKQAIAKIESGQTTSPAASTLEPIAVLLGVQLPWLLTGRNMLPHAEREWREWADVKGSAQAVGMGPGREAEEYAESYKLKFRAKSLSGQGLKAPNLEVCYGKGDSMLPRVNDGDAILFDRGDTKPSHNRIFIIRYEGGIYAKRLKKYGPHWFISTDNPDGDPQWREPKMITDDVDFAILGRVRWIGSWER